MRTVIRQTRSLLLLRRLLEVVVLLVKGVPAVRRGQKQLENGSSFLLLLRHERVHCCQGDGQGSSPHVHCF